MTVAELAGALGLFTVVALVLLVVLADGRITQAAEFDDEAEIRECLDQHPAPPSEGVEALEALVDDTLRRAASFEQWTEVRAWLEARPRRCCSAPRQDAGALDAALGKVGVSDDVRARLFARQRLPQQRLERLRTDEWPGFRPDKIPPLAWRERWNMHFVVVFGQSAQAVGVSVMMGVFFLVFGALTVDDATLAAWHVPAQDGWWLWSGQHLKVTALLAGFAGLSYAASSVLFREQRELFLRQLDHKMRQRLAVRAVYRGLRAGAEADSTRA